MYKFSLFLFFSFFLYTCRSTKHLHSKDERPPDSSLYRIIEFLLVWLGPRRIIGTDSNKLLDLQAHLLFPRVLPFASDCSHTDNDIERHLIERRYIGQNVVSDYGYYSLSGSLGVCVQFSCNLIVEDYS